MSFANISRKPNALIYSTHSHYMINPDWLDQAYIVENIAINYDKAVDISSISRSGNDVRAVKYRKFANENPGKTSYYQPVLDRLDVTPSVMELRDGCALVEGKSDYYIMRYMSEIIPIPNVLIVPAFGSSTLGNLISLTMALAKKFTILLDSDDAGKEAAKVYKKYDLGPGTLVDFSSLSGGSKEPENALEKDDRELIRASMQLDKPPTKKQIMEFFREALASGKVYKFSDGFTGKIAAVLKAFSAQ
jgi:predicted ATP-dependent endonuclease of OLD family